MLTFIHAADFHLDSAFGALDQPGQAAARRRESRETGSPSGGLREGTRHRSGTAGGGPVRQRRSLPGDRGAVGGGPGPDAGEVFISPGQSRLVRTRQPVSDGGLAGERVRIQREYPDRRGAAGAELGDPRGGILRPGTAGESAAGFTAPADGKIHIGLLHGELDGAEARYDPPPGRAAASGLSYLALGHVHKRSSPLTLGSTVCAWPGCPRAGGSTSWGRKVSTRGRSPTAERSP